MTRILIPSRDMLFQLSQRACRRLTHPQPADKLKRLHFDAKLWLENGFRAPFPRKEGGKVTFGTYAPDEILRWRLRQTAANIGANNGKRGTRSVTS